MRCRWIRWIPAGSTSARAEGRCTARPTAATRGRRSFAIFRRWYRSKPRHWIGDAVIRVALPAHLRNLAAVDGEVLVDVPGAVTQRALIDALESQYPVLRGTIRDYVTLKRRPFVRFFACGQDLSHEPLDALLPEGVVGGREPYLIVG